MPMNAGSVLRRQHEECHAIGDQHRCNIASAPPQSGTQPSRPTDGPAANALGKHGA